MAPKPMEKNSWVAVEDGEPFTIETSALIGYLGSEVITPLALIEERGEQIVVAWKADVFTGTGLVPFLRLAVPGLCGHYNCGGTIGVCLN